MGDKKTIDTKKIMKKKKIAVFANGWSNEYIESVLEGIKKEAAKDEVDIFLFLTYIYWNEPTIQSKCQLNILHLPNPKEFDGAIALANTFNRKDEADRVHALFRKKDVPMVSTEVKMPNTACVKTNNSKGMQELAEHLIEVHGAKKIVYVSGLEDNKECAERKQALVEVLEAHNLSLVGEFRGNFDFSGARRGTIKWFEDGGQLPDAFVCANDHMAIGVLETLRSYGYDVPRDTIVTGYDLIDDAKNIYPMIASVSKSGEILGQQTYLELKRQIINLDPSVEIVFDSKYVPSESCGCEPEKVAYDNRLDILKYSYSRNNKKNLEDLILQNLRIFSSRVDTKEAFNGVAKAMIDQTDYLGDDFCICTDPLFFEADDDVPKRIRGYSKKLDVLYGKECGKSRPISTFKSEELYPNYRHECGKSNLYVFVPINNLEYVIGYFVSKNNPELVYNLGLRKWIGEINSLFVTIRNYIFAQQNNRRLKQIYMTDILTGINNRTGCEKILFKFVEDEKEAGRSTMLLFADIDCMKQINDVYGHLNGDLAIKATADAMKESLPPGWLIGRYGGDEFVAVGPCINEEFAEAFRKDLSSSIKKVIKGLKIVFKLSVSVGYTIIRPDDDADIDDYISRADEYMYEQKKIAHKIMEEEHATQGIQES